MNRKAMLALPLVLVSLASCDVDSGTSWKDDAESIYVYTSFNQYGYVSGIAFKDREGVVNAYTDSVDLEDTNIWYCIDNDGIYVKQETTKYKTYDYDEKTKTFSNKKDVLSHRIDIHKYVGLPYHITYKVNL